MSGTEPGPGPGQEEARRSIDLVLAADPDGPALRRQLEDAELVVTPSEVTIRPPAGAEALVGGASGPLDTVAAVRGPQGDHLGEILVWLDRGVLSSAEYAWVTDDAPTGWPTADQVVAPGA